MTTTLRPHPAGAAVLRSPGHLSNIQVLRGIAALMVLIYHIGNELGDRGFPGDFPDLGAGSAGVDIFFVISGFIMVHSTAQAFGGNAGAPALFLSRRLVRLVPLYWLLTTVFVAAALWEAGRAGPSSTALKWFAASYAFLFYPHGNGDDFPLYAQGWTLNFEMFFYLCFAAALPVRRAAALWGLSIGLMGLALVGLVVALPWPVDRWADTNIVEFVLGMGLAQLHARGVRLPFPAALALAVSGSVAFRLTIGSVDTWLPYRGFVWGPPALAIVAAAALHDPRRTGPVRRALEALGDASYALYIVHYAFFVGLGHVLERFVAIAAMPPLLYCSLCFAGSILLAFATHRLIERPITRGLNRALDLPRRWRALTAGGPASS